MSDSNADEEPPKKCTPPQPSWLSSLPDDIVLRCLVRVPRSYHLNISWVSKDLRSLVRSPELSVLRSTIPKSSSLHVCLEQDDDDDEDNSFFHWFTLNETSTTTTMAYELVPNPTTFPPRKYGSSAVAVGSKIFFIGGSLEPSSDLWILDTRSGNITQGPSLSVPRKQRNAAVEVIDGKIYVLGGGPPSIDGMSHEVEVFHPNLETWEFAGVEEVLKISDRSGLVEEKVYMVDYEKTSVYDPREGEGERLVQIVSQRLLEGGSMDKLKDMPHRACVVEGVLFAFFINTGLMWFDTTLNVWRRLVGRDGKELTFILCPGAIAEYEGRLAVLYMGDEDIFDIPVTLSVRCMFVSLDIAGGKICGTIDWSGIVATVPFLFRFHHCLAVSH